MEPGLLRRDKWMTLSESARQIVHRRITGYDRRRALPGADWSFNLLRSPITILRVLLRPVSWKDLNVIRVLGVGIADFDRIQANVVFDPRELSSASEIG